MVAPKNSQSPLSLALWIALVLISIAALCASRMAVADGAPTAQPLVLGGTMVERGALVNGRRFIALRLWDSASVGTQVCPESSAAVDVTQGQWSLALGPECTSAVRARSSLWLETIVDGISLGRAAIGAVPYALEAGRAAEASGGLATRLATIEARASGQRQVEVGAASSFSLDPVVGDTPWSEVANGPTVTFTPRSTGRYRLAVPVMVLGGTTQNRPARARVRCSPATSASWESSVYGPHSAPTHPQIAEAVVQMTAGVSQRCALEVSGSRAVGAREEGSAIFVESMD